MKKLIILVIIALGMSSCEKRVVLKIINIKSDETTGKCKYFLNIGRLEDISFIDSCNKFNIGDRIKISKL